MPFGWNAIARGAKGFAHGAGLLKTGPADWMVGRAAKWGYEAGKPVGIGLSYARKYGRTGYQNSRDFAAGVVSKNQNVWLPSMARQRGMGLRNYAIETYKKNPTAWKIGAGAAGALGAGGIGYGMKRRNNRTFMGVRRPW